MADRLEAEGVPGHVQVISRHVLTAELVQDMVSADLVIFLDDAVCGPPGELSCRRLVPDASAVSTMAHFLDPRELLAWCEALYQHRPEVWLVTLAADAFDYGLYGLSPAAHAVVVPMLERVRGLIAGVRPATI